MTDSVLNLIAFGFWVGLLCAALGVAGMIADAVRRRHEDKRPGRYDDDLLDATKPRENTREKEGRRAA